jgi:hypothetical protein
MKIHIEKISKILGVLKTKAKIENISNEKLLKVKNIFQTEYNFLSDKNNKLDKIRKKYIDNLIKDIDLIDSQIKQYIEDNIQNIINDIINNISEEYGLGETKLISDYPIEEQIKMKLSSISIKTELLLFKNINNNIAGIYSALINYYTRIVSIVEKDIKWDNITNELIFKDFQKNEEFISEKDKIELEFLINHFLKRFSNLYIITDDYFYNEIENIIKEKPELLIKKNVEELINLIHVKKEEYINKNNMLERFNIKYKF